MTNIDLVKKVYACFEAGDLEGVLALFDPSIEWHECKGMPFVIDDGIYYGPDAIMKNVFMNLPVFFDGLNIAISELFGAGDKVVMVGFYQGTNRVTGHSFIANVAHTWTVMNGKLTHLFHAADTATIIS